MAGALRLRRRPHLRAQRRVGGLAGLVPWRSAPVARAELLAGGGQGAHPVDDAVPAAAPRRTRPVAHGRGPAGVPRVARPLRGDDGLAEPPDAIPAADVSGRRPHDRLVGGHARRRALARGDGGERALLRGRGGRVRRHGAAVARSGRAWIPTRCRGSSIRRTA